MHRYKRTIRKKKLEKRLKEKRDKIEEGKKKNIHRLLKVIIAYQSLIKY